MGCRALLLAFWGVAALAQTAPANQHFREGLRLRDEGKKIQALQEFRRAAKLDPQLPGVDREIGLILLDRRDFPGAGAAFRTAARRDPADFESRYNLALSLANAGKKQEGVQEIKALLRDKPGWGQAYFGLGHIYALQGRAAEAEQELRTALRLDSTLFRAYFELGKILEQKGDREGAIQAFSAGARLSPDSAAARFRLATLLRQAGRAKEAEAEFSAVRELRDTRFRGEQSALAYQQGMAHLESGEVLTAIRELKRAFELRPDFPEIRDALADAHERQAVAFEEKGEIPAAIEQFRLALALSPSAGTENHVGVLLARTGRVEEAIESFRRALKLQPGHANAEVNLSRALELKSSR